MQQRGTYTWDHWDAYDYDDDGDEMTLHFRDDVTDEVFALIRERDSLEMQLAKQLAEVKRLKDEVVRMKTGKRWTEVEIAQDPVTGRRIYTRVEYILKAEHIRLELSPELAL